MSKFAILSLPRSGSHMLASALDSHPAICCTGEYEMVEKFPIGRYPGAVVGCIVQSYHIDRHVAPPWLPEAKLILLFRPTREIIQSLYHGSENGTNYSQCLTQADHSGLQRHPYPDRHYSYLEAQRDIISEYARGRNHIMISYRSLCRDKDVRAIRWEVAHRICDFLEVDRQHPLKTTTHKPT